MEAVLASQSTQFLPIVVQQKTFVLLKTLLAKAILEECRGKTKYPLKSHYLAVTVDARAALNKQTWLNPTISSGSHRSLLHIVWHLEIVVEACRCTTDQSKP